MDHIGIDVHKRESQLYILAQGGEVIEQRIRSEAERFAAVLGTRPRAPIVMEASPTANGSPAASPVSSYCGRPRERVTQSTTPRRCGP